MAEPWLLRQCDFIRSDCYTYYINEEELGLGRGCPHKLGTSSGLLSRPCKMGARCPPRPIPAPGHVHHSPEGTMGLRMLGQLWEPRPFLCSYSNPGGWQCRLRTKVSKFQRKAPCTASTQLSTHKSVWARTRANCYHTGRM